MDTAPSGDVVTRSQANRLHATQGTSIWMPCSVSTRQIGATPKRSLWLAMNAQTCALVSDVSEGRSRARRRRCRVEDFDGLFKFGIAPFQRPNLGSSLAGDSVALALV
jgi:hypothetical protein